ncbi:MAG: hypothetical protein E7471_01515 [Ruminococcaceae bacterium]|nr:hypothetical protein [Oscillospiraceae bacterium]
MKKSRILSLLLALTLLTTALAVPSLPQTIDGASVRTTGEPGLRFYSTVSKAEVRADDVVEYGTILIPTENLKNANDFVIDANLDGRTVAKVPAVNTYKIEGDTLTFTAVIIGIKPENYTRAYSARSYITYTEDGQEKTIYSDEITSRDIYTVAKAALENDDLTEDEMIYLNEVVDYVEGKTHAITYTEPDENVVIPTEIVIDGCTTTISWTVTGGAKPDKTYFESGTDYTAVITITKDTAFSPNDKVTINGETIAHTVSNEGKTITVTKTYDLKDAGYSGIY